MLDFLYKIVYKIKWIIKKVQGRTGQTGSFAGWYAIVPFRFIKCKMIYIFYLIKL